jgi:hypothetical protein
MSQTSYTPLHVGSLWHRWDPHIHAPETIMANHFTGDDRWNEFFQKIEASDPPIRALGITDYWNLKDYETVRASKEGGRIPGVTLLFPNIELRLDIHTDKGNGINLHLLFSPDDADHVSQIERFLQRLEFKYQGHPYPCTRFELVRLGKAVNKEIVDDNAALREGANQFKVSFAQLQKLWNEDVWVRTNGLIAVSGGSNDGTSGLASDGWAFSSFRIERRKRTRIRRSVCDSLQ